MDEEKHLDIATFAAGSFWDVEAAFHHADGVVSTTAGYTGGSVPDPTWEQVCSGTTGHIEAVRVIFDTDIVSYDSLLDILWDIISGIQIDTLEPGSGPYSRNVIFYHSEEQKARAESSKARQMACSTSRETVAATEIIPAQRFFPAEECHQQFYEKSGQAYSSVPKYWE